MINVIWYVNKFTYDTDTGDMVFDISCYSYRSRDINKLLDIIGTLGSTSSWSPTIPATDTSPVVNGTLRCYLKQELRPRMEQVYEELSDEVMNQWWAAWFNQRLNSYMNDDKRADDYFDEEYD